MNNYTQGTTYSPGTVVLHEGKLYSKDNDNDQSPPDAVAGGWSLMPAERNNLQEYLQIERALGSYEARVAAHRADVLSKLQAAGLSVNAVKATLSTL